VAFSEESTLLALQSTTTTLLLFMGWSSAAVQILTGLAMFSTPRVIFFFSSLLFLPHACATQASVLPISMIFDETRLLARSASSCNWCPTSWSPT
jgi:hypothetical protein